MIIGINGNEANVPHRVGVGQYAYELLCHLDPQNLRVYLSNDPLPDMPKLNYEIFGPERLWTLTGLQRKLLTNPPDILFTPTHYTPVYIPCPSVISIMDLSFERFPQYFKKKDLYQLKYWTKFSAKQAKKIITISHFSKEEICRIYGFSSDKVRVTYPGFDKERFNTKVKRKTKNYFLYLGTLQPRKNLVRLVEAFSSLGPRTHNLVIAGMIAEGRGGWMYQEIFDKVKKLGLGKRVIFTGFVPDSDVAPLIASATAFVLPSLYEGFGIPAVEAMATGVPVVVSKTSSLPEICGESAIYIDHPESVTSIKLALEKVLTFGPTQRQKRIDLGLTWVKRYNWEDTAQKTLEVLYEAAQR